MIRFNHQGHTPMTDPQQSEMRLRQTLHARRLVLGYDPLAKPGAPSFSDRHFGKIFWAAIALVAVATVMIASEVVSR